MGRGYLYIRLEQPKSPTRLNNFTLGYVTLDLLAQPVTVRCYMKKPSGGYSQIGADISVIAGGNSGLCPLNSSMISENGTYQFYASATTASDSSTSETISVDYNTSGPGTPSSYSKEKISSCEYKVSFKTADDGQTTKVEIYRSDKTSFTADSGSRIKDLPIGPNQNGSYNDIVGDCDKTYYYVLRAFDSAGNGSGLIGDSVTVTIEGTSSTTTQATETTSGTGAIVVSNVTLPEESLEEVTDEDITTLDETSAESEGQVGEGAEVLGEQTSQSFVGRVISVISNNKLLAGILVFVPLVIFVILYVKRKQGKSGSRK